LPSRKPQTGGPSRSKSRGAGLEETPLLDILSSLDEDTLIRLRDSLRAQMGRTDEEGDPLARFDEFLRRVETISTEPPDADDPFFDDLVAEMTQLAIDDNGGDPQARQVRARAYARLKGAIAGNRLDAAGLMLIAKVFSDSGWSVPDHLKSRLVDLLEASGTAPEETGPLSLETALADIVRASEGDAFAAYDALNSVLAAFPSDVAARMAATLGEGREPLLLQVLSGFAMHRDPSLARAAIEALRQAGKAHPVESALVERLVRMRPWLPDDRQGPLDETIRALRANALPPIETERPAPSKCFVLACDGSGAGGALATLKASDGWRFVAAMTKPAGVEEVLSLEGLGKRQADQTLRSMRESVTAAETDVAGVARYLELSIGENVAAKSPPPFKLVSFAENLGLGPIAPRVLSPGDLIAEILADWPEAQKDAAAAAAAHKAVIDGALEQPWFEAGENVERLLAPIRGAKARVKALLTAYLPERREFWARTCARSAFALLMQPRAHGALGRGLALVGRDIADGAPLSEIPLMRRIAEMTVSAYESRR
jgi:hypothetical protein